jgi:hypothetical protein
LEYAAWLLNLIVAAVFDKRLSHPRPVNGQRAAVCARTPLDKPFLAAGVVYNTLGPAAGAGALASARTVPFLSSLGRAFDLGVFTLRLPVTGLGDKATAACCLGQFIV